MTDKNGKEMKTGDVVMISGGYFKADNGLFRVKNSPGDDNWLGEFYCLTKLNKNRTESKCKYKTAFWPLFVTVNGYEEGKKAKQHNIENATIEALQ